MTQAENKERSPVTAPVVKPSRLRSPNYPAINLKAAVALARIVYSGARGSPGVGRAGTDEPVLAGLWGRSLKSSAFKLALAAVRAFGLLVDDPAAKGIRVKLSHLALDIVADYPDGSAEQKQAIQKAALAPAMHKKLYDKYGADLPTDLEVRRYLLREHEPRFNDKTVGLFIEEYKSTMAFAGLAGADKINGAAGAGNGVKPPPPQVKAGDYVQWTCNGADQFKTPRLVRDLSDDGLYAFVEGSETGLPVGELTVSEKPNPTPPIPLVTPGQPTPPRNPFYKPEGEGLPPRPGSEEEKTNIGEGLVVLQWPSQLSQESVEELEYWFAGLMRKARRKAGLPTESKAKV